MDGAACGYTRLKAIGSPGARFHFSHNTFQAALLPRHASARWPCLSCTHDIPGGSNLLDACSDTVQGVATKCNILMTTRRATSQYKYVCPRHVRLHVAWQSPKIMLLQIWVKQLLRVFPFHLVFHPNYDPRAFWVESGLAENVAGACDAWRVSGPRNIQV